VSRIRYAFAINYGKCGLLCSINSGMLYDKASAYNISQRFKMYKYLFALFLPAVLFTGCYYGTDTLMDYAHLNDKTYEPTYELDLYWEGTNQPDRKYEQIAVLEARGNQTDGLSSLLHQLKLKGQEMGADALINIKTSNTERETGSLALIVLDPQNDHSTKYYALVMSCVAVKYK
jgi:hypothetical protein